MSNKLPLNNRTVHGVLKAIPLISQIFFATFLFSGTTTGSKRNFNRRGIFDGYLIANFILN